MVSVGSKVISLQNLTVHVHAPEMLNSNRKLIAQLPIRQ